MKYGIYVASPQATKRTTNLVCGAMIELMHTQKKYGASDHITKVAMDAVVTSLNKELTRPISIHNCNISS